MHLALQAAALLSDLKDTERPVDLKQDFCQLCRLFPIKYFIYEYCPAHNPAPSQLQQCHSQGECKSTKIITQKKSLWEGLFPSILLSPSEVLHTFYGQKHQQNMRKLWPLISQRHRQGMYKFTLTQICTDSKEKNFHTWPVNYKTPKSYWKWSFEN